MSDQIVLIDFKKKSCGADDDESENEDTASGEESENESEDDGCGTKLRAVASLICQWAMFVFLVQKKEMPRFRKLVIKSQIQFEFVLSLKKCCPARIIGKAQGGM